MNKMSRSDFADKIDVNVKRILESVKQLIANAKLGENDTADREGLEIVLHSNLIVTSVEELLRLVTEMKLSLLTMDWKHQDEIVSRQIENYRVREERNRKCIQEVADEVKETLDQIDIHLNESRSKRTRISPNVL